MQKVDKRQKGIEAVKPANQDELPFDLTGTQEERYAAQAFLKMLKRNKKALQNSFVSWVIWKSQKETGPFYPLVLHMCAERWQSNLKREEKIAALHLEQEKHLAEQAESSDTDEL